MTSSINDTANEMQARLKQTPSAGPTESAPADAVEPPIKNVPEEFPRLPVAPRGGGAKPKVLVELLACLEGYAGIPQETRLVYSMLSTSTYLELSGLLNTTSGSRVTIPVAKPPRRGGSASRRALAGSRSRYRQSRILIALDRSQSESKARPLILRDLRKGGVRWQVLEWLYKLGFRDRGEVLEIDPKDFGDALWMQLFDKTLTAADREPVLGTRFFASTISQDVAAYFCRSKRHAQRLNTAGWDFFLCQKGCPYQLAEGTRAVVRYHDAIPVFYPHTITDQNVHLKRHYDVLRASVARGAFFACVSGPVRDDLLRLVPEAEASSTVLPDVVSPGFRPTPARKEDVVEPIVLRECPINLYRPRTNLVMRTRRLMADEHLDRYVMAVSTLEPRKNYGRLLQAFEEANRRGKPFRLIMVANPGWRFDEVLPELRALVTAGRVMHLSKVPLEELRVLYSNAQAVVCPSRSEGFDLSGVEAMLCGAPVIASDIPVHRWVYGDAARYFDPYDSEALAQQLVDVMKESKTEGSLGDLRARGLKQGRLYTPEAIAPKWEALFERLMAEKAGWSRASQQRLAKAAA